MTVEVSPVRDEQESPPLLPGLIFDAERRFRAYADTVLQDRGLTLTEWTALAIVWWDGQPRSSAELARKAYVSSQAMGQVVATLERRGLLGRHPDPTHGRRLLVELTAEGRELVDSCHEGLRDVERRFLEPLNPREREFFISLLAACVADGTGSSPSW